MSAFEKIQQACSDKMAEFISALFSLEETPIKYFYLNLDFIQKLGQLSYDYLTIDKNLKDKLIRQARVYFDKYIENNTAANIPALTISGIGRKTTVEITRFGSFFKDAATKVTLDQKDYVVEFCFYELLKEVHAEEYLLRKQEANFLITYFDYIFAKEKEMILLEKIRQLYKQYKSTSSGKRVLERISEIDAIKMGKPNELLKEKISSLYVLKEYESKIHFIFSIEQSPDNEEIRDALTIMQSGSSPDRENLYRGQASAHWKLDSSLTREPKFLKCEKELYYEILSLKPDSFINDESVYERLITMQHFGMPTRLMDLSRNPLVAIFFACNNLGRKHDDGVIYVFTPESKCVLNFEDPGLEDLKNLYSVKDDVCEFLDKLSYIRGIAKNQRISSQSGDFLFVGKNVKPQDIQNEVAAMIVIDAEVKPTLLELLEKLNVHGGVVYPDLSHMSNYIKDKYKRN